MNWNSVNIIKKKTKQLSWYPGWSTKYPQKKQRFTSNNTWFDLQWTDGWSPNFFRYRRHNLVSWSLLVDPFLVSLGTLIPEKLARYFNGSSCDRPLKCSGSPPLFLSPRARAFSTASCVWKPIGEKSYWLVLTMISCTNHFTCKKIWKTGKNRFLPYYRWRKYQPQAFWSLPVLVLDGYYNMWIHVISIYIA